MSVLNIPSVPANPASRLRWALADALTVTRRNLSHTLRVPEKLIGATVTPIIFVLLFGYVFGSAIRIPGGGNYREFLMPGIFTMGLASTLAATAVGVASDMEKGIIDRFRSLPMARSAALLGGALANMVESCLGLIITVICGLFVGWQPHNGIANTLAAFGLLLLLGFAWQWVGTFIGLIVRSTESADTIAMVMFFPLTFVANTFVPPQGMPAWLRTVAEWNPLSATVSACRELFGSPGIVHSSAWPMQHPVIASLGWSLLILVVFAPLAVRRYRSLS